VRILMCREDSKDHYNGRTKTIYFGLLRGGVCMSQRIIPDERRLFRGWQATNLRNMG